MPRIQPIQSLIDANIAVLKIPSNGKAALALVNPGVFIHFFQVQKEVPTDDYVTPADSTPSRGRRCATFYTQPRTRRRQGLQLLE
jgi:hypothetical protein